MDVSVDFIIHSAKWRAVVAQIHAIKARIKQISRDLTWRQLVQAANHKFAETDLIDLEVRTSTIPGAGLGVFARHDLDPLTVICEYRGRVSYDLSTGDTYGFFIAEPRFGIKPFLIIGSPESGVGSLINDCVVYRQYTSAQWLKYILDEEPMPTYAGTEYNCAYQQMGNKLWLVTSKAVPKGAELFASYGTTYWYGKAQQDGLISS